MFGKYVSLVAMPVFILAACGQTEQAETAPSPAPAPVSSEQVVGFAPDADLIKSHMAYLADDALEGREAGTEGYEKAAIYVAKEFEKLGLTPAGENGTYFQRITFKRGVRQADMASLEAVHADGREVPMENGVDYAIGGSVGFAQSEIVAPIVFAGFGIVAPEAGRDDYEGLDVEGKIVATFARTPSGFDSEERAYYGAQKGAEASKRGAIGILSLPTPTSETVYSFGRLVSEGRLDGAQLSWVDDEGDAFSRAPGIQGGATLSMEGAEKLFADAPTGWESLLELAEAEGGITPTFDLPVSVTIKQVSTIDEVTSPNIAGMIEGSDPVLKEEVIVLSAHLDHIGISQSFEADTINNGALDNAAGVATLLEAARLIQAGPAPRRSIMFLAVTAEEKGLLGAQYFAKNPTVAAERIVGNVNLDMPVLTYNFTDLIVFGGTRSTINAAVVKAAGEMGLVVNPDPMAEQGIFTRSDHYRFVEEGVPSVMLSTGFANGGEEAWNTHFATNYHRPSDDMNNNLDFEAAAKFAELKTRIALTLANDDERPLWNKGDFFARQFNGPQLP